MKRTVAAMLAAIVVFGHPATSDAGPFPEIPLSDDTRPSHRAAYTSLLAGAGLVGASFVFSYRAEQSYEAYQSASDPQTILDRYDETENNDRWSNGTLLAGQALIATGIYLRFLRPRPVSRLSFAVDPGRCALSFRF